MILSLRKTTFTAVVLAASLATLAVSAQQPATPPAKATTPIPAATHSAATPASGDRGQRLWEANCNRCHNAPETLNPRITGTIVRHMRVRANLSAADEREILRFLNP